MRILWVSNAPWAGSGYGQQTDIFTKRFVQAGHDVAIVANHGLQEAPTSWKHGIRVFPQGGQDSIQTFAKHFQADVVILLYDTWVMKPDEWPDIRMAMWAPIDHYPPPPEVLGVLSHPRVDPIAMSRFGEAELKKFSGKMDIDPLYVPHGIETDVFRPKPEFKAGIRDTLEIPEDAFVVGMVAANAGWNPAVARKSFPQAFDAMGRFMKTHDDAYLYVHTRLHGGSRGQDLGRLAAIMEIPEERFRCPPVEAWHLGIMDSEFVCNIYNSFDVLLNPSMGEGFGIPIVEAQACGVPVICSNHSAMTELTKAGWLVEGDPWWDELQCSFGFTPFIADIERCLNLAYICRDDQSLKDRARRFAEGYDADVVMEKYWTPVLERLARPAEVKPFPKAESRQVRRARERAEAKK